jgi:hypothetical protein
MIFAKYLIILLVFAAVIEAQPVKDFKRNCIINAVHNISSYDVILLQVFSKLPNHFDKEAKQRNIEQNSRRVEKILEDAKKNCESDLTYAELFDDLLRIRNGVVDNLSQNYCFRKFVVEKNLIKSRDFDVNPRKINTQSINCHAIIEIERTAHEKRFRRFFSEVILLKNYQIECVLKVYEIQRMFEAEVAREVAEQSRVPTDLKRKLRQNAEKIERDFILSNDQCFVLKKIRHRLWE